jgi:hypothetical protein
VSKKLQDYEEDTLLNMKISFGSDIAKWMQTTDNDGKNYVNLDGFKSIMLIEISHSDFMYYKLTK